MYHAYRYPYYEKGIVKAIFIFPAFIFLTVSGLEAANKISKKLLYPIALFILIYCILIIKIYWIMPFDY